MFNEYSAIKNKQPTHSKIYFEQYLINSEEPMDYVSDGRHEPKVNLLENSDELRQRFRQLAKRLRKYYS